MPSEGTKNVISTVQLNMESQSLNTSPVHTHDHPGSKIDDQDQNHNVVRKRKTKNHQNSSRRHSAPGKFIFF